MEKKQRHGTRLLNKERMKGWEKWTEDEDA